MKLQSSLHVVVRLLRGELQVANDGTITTDHCIPDLDRGLESQSMEASFGQDFWTSGFVGPA